MKLTNWAVWNWLAGFWRLDTRDHTVTTGSNLVHRTLNPSAPLRTSVGWCGARFGTCFEPAPWFSARCGKKGLWTALHWTPASLAPTPSQCRLLPGPSPYTFTLVHLQWATKLFACLENLDCASNRRPNKMYKFIQIFTNIPYHPTYITNKKNNKSIGNSLRYDRFSTQVTFERFCCWQLMSEKCHN